MKNFNLIEWLQTDSHGKQRVSGMRRYAAMITLLLTLACGNVWGTQTSLISGVTLPDIPSSVLNMETQTDFTPASNWIVFNPYADASSKSWLAGYSTGTGSASVSAPSGSIAPFVNLSSKTCYKVRQAARTYAVRFSKATDISFMVCSGGSRSVLVSLFSYNGSKQELVDTKSEGANAVTELYFDELDLTKEYIAYIYENSSSDGWLYEIAVKQAGPGPYSVTYDKNGGTGTMTDASSPYVKNTTVTTLANTFTAPTGKTFTGWNTRADGTGTSYAAGATFTAVKDVKLYAQWAYPATGTGTITYTLTKASDAVSGAVSGVSTISGFASTFTKSTLTFSTTSGQNGYCGRIESQPTSYSASAYVDLPFTVASGYTFNPTSIDVKVNPFSGTGNMKAKVALIDDDLNIVSNELSCSKSTDNVVTFASGAFTDKLYTGTVHIRIYLYCETTGKYAHIKSPITITGTVAAAAAPCSDETGLAYGETTVNKTYGDAVFTNTLTNSNSLSVTYSSTNTSVATVNSSTGAVTIKAAGTTTIKATWAGNATYCEDEVSYTLNVKPAVGSVSGTWDRFGGETISLSVTPSGGSSYTYQWQKWYNDQWNNVSNGTDEDVVTSGATSNNLQITNCSKENSGSYRCQVTSASQTNETGGYQVKVYVLECYNGGTTVYNFTRDGENQRGSVTIDLAASTGYTFKVHADNDYYGNDGTINSDATNWVLCNNSTSACTTNLTVNSGLGGTFTFGIEYSTGGNSSVEGEPEISVTYPRKRIYLSPGVWDADGAKFAYNYWRDGVSAQWTDFLTSDDCGMYADIPQWNGVAMIAVRLKNTTTTPNWDDKWNQTGDLTITSNDYIVVSNWDDISYSSTYAAPTYTISYNKGTSGSGTKSDETKTCGVDFTLPSSAVFTRTGYTQTGWTTSDGGAQEYALGGTYTTNEDKTFYPVWTVNNYDLTWNLGGGTTTSAGTGIASGVSVNTTSSVAYGASLTAPTVTKANYDFSAWSPSVASTMPAAATTYTATWTAQTHDVSFSLTNAAYSSGTDEGDDVATYGTNYSVTFAATSGYVFPSDITVQIGGVTKTKGTHYTWNSSTGVLVVTGSYITGDIVVTITALEDVYTVTYAANGGSGSVPTDENTYDSGDEVTVLGKNTLSKSGYTFCGWSYNGYVYVEGDKFNITESATLTAVWNQNATTVTITNFATSNTNTSNNIPDDNSKYFYGYKGTVSDANALTLTSNDGNDRGQNSGVEMRLTYNKKMRVYANNTTNAAPATFTGVTAISFKWMFIASGNSGNTELTSSYTVKVGSTTVANAVSITGKTNDGYATVNITGLANLNGYVEILFGGSSSSYNVYLDDIAITYSASTYKKVTFNKGSGPSTVSGLPADRYVPSGSKIAEPSTDPTAANYIFNGWVTTSGGSTPFDFSGTITTDKTIYAKWTEKTSPGSGTVSGTTSICSGSNTNVTLSTSVSGASYQLYKDNVASGDPKPGTGSALTWSVSAAGVYTVKAVETATHASGDMGGSATISIYTALSKTTDPTSSKSATVGVGCALDGLTYAGNANVAFKWQTCKSDGTDASDITSGSQYSNYTTATMTFTPAAAGTYYFRCVVSDDCGSSFNTSVVTVTAKVAPTVYTLSGTTSICSGETATITLADSEDGIEYQLLKGGVAEGDPVDGTGDALEWEVSAAGTYTVKTVETVTYAEATMSGSAVITIKTATSISTQPTTSVTAHDGVNFTLGSNLVGAGEGTLTYQWYSYTSSGGAGEATVGSATTTKTLTTSKSAGTYYYKVEVIGTCGSVKSNMITLTVDNKHLLTYNANNGSGAPGSSYIDPGSTTLSSTMPTRSGYIFLGWNTNSSGTGDMYQPSATYTMPATATTLWAAWGSACFNVSDASKKTMPDGQPAGTVITGGGMINGTITGGTLTYTGTDVAGLNGNAKGLIFNNDNDELTVNITDGMLQEGTVIVIGSYGTASSSSHTNGLNVSGNNMSPETVVSSTSNNSISQRYVVADGDGIEGTSSFTIRRVASTDQMMLNTISVAGCMSCNSFEPSLSYDNTTLYAVGGKPREARPTLTDNTSGGAVTYSSSNTDVVTVNASTGLVTAVGAGTAKVTATIAAVDDYCPARASVNFTVPALVQQTINTGAAWGTVPDMTFPGDPTETLTKNANIAATGYGFDDSSTKSGLSSKITGVPSSTSKNDSYYLSLSFNTPSYNVLLSNVVVPIQPVSQTVSAIATLYDGSTTITSSEVADIPAGAVKQAVFTFTPTVVAAGKMITVKVFVYDQTTGTNGFRLASPIMVSGCVLEDQTFTDANSTGVWSDPANWDGGSLPEIYHDVVIEKPATVDIAHATAKSVVIYNNGDSKTGKLTIQANKGLEVAETVQKTTNGSSYSGTGEADLVLESNEYGNASLIFNNNNHCQATVQMYSKASISGGKWNWQYVGTPFENEIPLYNYYGGYMYKWNNSGSWDVVHGTDPLEPFAGYCLTQASATTHVMSGELVATDGITKAFDIGEETDMVIANSWTAPIYIDAFTTEGEGATFTSEPATIYLFNTGMDSTGTGGAGTEPGTYVALPVHSATSFGVEFIAPMQGFFVTTNGDDGAAGKITLKYDELVRPAGVHTGIVAGPMKLPKRTKAAVGKPDVMKIWANGSEYNDRVVILAREDFSEGFDNGWDGEKLSFGNASPSVYVINEEGGYDAVSAIPEYEGTLVGFRAGSEDNVYTMTFEYNGEEVLYLNDLKAQISAEIANGQTYMFTTEEGDSEVRFIISHNPIRRITTGVDDVETGTKARKVLINEKIYIIRKGRVYSVDGQIVK